MKRRKLLRHLRKHGCALLREANRCYRPLPIIFTD